uniref:Solute carrier family 3 member 2 N-terminal domain-containing protein n=1 Tax=Ditylenchus dipsaci TaxID=166011 RepID=A0A915E6L6_9BILA
MSAEDSLMPMSEAGKTPQNYNIESGQAKFNKDSENVDVQATTKLIGLTKEQLEQYRNDPFWKPVRYALFVLFWLVWLAMFIGAILIVVLSPKCAAKVEPKYYENLISYQVYTPTFYDTNGDGVTAIWANFIESNKDEFLPQEVMNLMEVDPRYGTQDDLKALISATHNSRMHFIMDLPLTVSVNSQLAKSIAGLLLVVKRARMSVF